MLLLPTGKPSQSANSSKASLASGVNGLVTLSSTVTQPPASHSVTTPTTTPPSLLATPTSLLAATTASSSLAVAVTTVAAAPSSTTTVAVTTQPSTFPAQVSQSHTHQFNGPFSGTTRVSRYQKGETNLDFTGARDSEWQWHQLGRMQVCILLQTDNHASTPPLSFLPAGCPSCRPTNGVKALKAQVSLSVCR